MTDEAIDIVWVGLLMASIAVIVGCFFTVLA